MTLEDPLGDRWKIVNGHLGIILSAQVLKERAEMFVNRVLDPMDYCVWFTMAFQSGLTHIRQKHFGKMQQIPEGTIIKMALVNPDSIYYDKFKAYGITDRAGGGRYVMPRNHAMWVILQRGGMAIPDKWVSFPFTRNLLQGQKPNKFTVLPYTPPSITGDITLT